MTAWYKSNIVRATVGVIAFIGLSAYLIHCNLEDQRQQREGGNYITLENDTDYILKIYCKVNKRYITRSLQPWATISYGPFGKKIGSRKTELRIESKRWDRAIKFEFKGYEHTWAKRLVLDRKYKSRARGITITVDASWPFFSTEDGYHVTIEEKQPPELPNFARAIKKLFE